MIMEKRCITPDLEKCCHVYGIFRWCAKRRKTQHWAAIAERLKSFLEERDVRKGWKIYEVGLSCKSVSFVVESASHPDYIQERLFYYTLVYLRKEFPKLGASLKGLEDELFWSSIVSPPIAGLKHLENKLNQISRWKNSCVKYEVKEDLAKYLDLPW